MVKILYIEDSQYFSEPIGYKLKACGYDVSESYQGETGLFLAETMDPDLIILDLK